MANRRDVVLLDLLVLLPRFATHDRQELVDHRSAARGRSLRAFERPGRPRDGRARVQYAHKNDPGAILRRGVGGWGHCMMSRPEPSPAWWLSAGTWVRTTRIADYSCDHVSSRAAQPGEPLQLCAEVSGCDVLAALYRRGA